MNDEPVKANGVFYYNPACFAPSALGELGNLGRNAYFGPHSTVLNATVQKNTAITERFNLQFRAEFFNAFNHPNFSLPSGGFTQGVTTSAATVVTGTPNATFGQITSTSGEPRQIQFGLKLVF